MDKAAAELKLWQSPPHLPAPRHSGCLDAHVEPRHQLSCLPALRWENQRPCLGAPRPLPLTTEPHKAARLTALAPDRSDMTLPYRSTCEAVTTGGNGMHGRRGCGQTVPPTIDGTGWPASR